MYCRLPWRRWQASDWRPGSRRWPTVPGRSGWWVRHGSRRAHDRSWTSSSGSARAMLAGLGYSRRGRWAGCKRVLRHQQPSCPSSRPPDSPPPGASVRPCSPRSTTCTQQATSARPLAELPAGAPFGTAMIDTRACTLCLACVTVCPGKALLDGHDVPQLRFLEANCVQCGLCTRSCPENAIWISPEAAVRGRGPRPPPGPEGGQPLPLCELRQAVRDDGRHRPHRAAPRRPLDVSGPQDPATPAHVRRLPRGGSDVGPGVVTPGAWAAGLGWAGPAPSARRAAVQAAGRASSDLSLSFPSFPPGLAPSLLSSPGPRNPWPKTR